MSRLTPLPLLVLVSPAWLALAQDAPPLIQPPLCSVICQSHAQWDDGPAVRASVDRLAALSKDDVQKQLRNLETDYKSLWLRWSIKVEGYEAQSALLDTIPGAFGGALLSYAADQTAQQMDDYRQSNAIVLVENKLRELDQAAITRGRALTGEGFDQWRNQLFDSKFLAQFDPTVRTAVHSIREEHLKRAIDDLEASDRRMQAEIDVAKQNLLDLDSRVSTLVESVRTRFAEATTNQKVIADLAQDALRQSKMNAVDITEMQGILWGKMTSAERLAAVNNGNFLRGVDEKTRDSLTEELRKSAQIETAQETLGTFNQAAGDVLQIADALGIDTREGSKAVAVFSSGAQLALGIASGNPLGMLSGIAGLSKAFGGGGADPEVERQAQLMRALAAIQQSLHKMRQEMFEIHSKTMERLDQLQANMNMRFDQVTSISAAIRDTALLTDERIVALGQAPTNICISLLSNLDANAFDDPYSIEDRFSDAANTFQACRRGLREHLFTGFRPALGLSATRIEDATQAIPPDARMAFARFRRLNWDPMLRLSLAMNPVASGRAPNSANRLFAVLASQHDTVQRSAGIWKEHQDQEIEYTYEAVLGTTRVVNGLTALEDPIAVEHLKRLGDAAFAIAPTLERVSADAASGPLQSAAELRSPKGAEIARAGRGDARVIFAHLLALTDIARAQNSMLAGIALLPDGITIIDGALATPPTQAQWDAALQEDEKAAAEGTAPRCSTSLQTYNFSCVLVTNPIARYNLGLAWSAHRFGDIAKQPCQPGATRDQCRGYRMEYNGGNAARMANYLGMVADLSNRLSFTVATATTPSSWKIAPLPASYFVSGETGKKEDRETLWLSVPDWDVLAVGHWALVDTQRALDERRAALTDTAALLAFVPGRACDAKDAECTDRNAVATLIGRGFSSE